MKSFLSEPSVWPEIYRILKETRTGEFVIECAVLFHGKPWVLELGRLPLLSIPYKETQIWKLPSSGI
jgi:hypothetical protein